MWYTWDETVLKEVFFEWDIVLPKSSTTSYEHNGISFIFGFTPGPLATQLAWNRPGSSWTWSIYEILYSLRYHRQQTPFVGFVGYDPRTKNTGPTRERIRAQLAMLGSLNGWHGWLMDVNCCLEKGETNIEWAHYQGWFRNSCLDYLILGWWTELVIDTDQAAWATLGEHGEDSRKIFVTTSVELWVKTKQKLASYDIWWKQLEAE